MRRVVVFANVKSGRGRQLGDALRGMTEAGLEIDSVRFDLSREAVRSVVSAAIGRSTSMVVACGGDGTVGSVVDAVVGMDVTLGVVAAGTSNNFARSLGVKPSVKGSLEALATGREMTIDVGEVNGHYFSHAAILGLNVAFAKEAQKYRRVLGRFSYPLASLLVYRARRKLSLKLEQSGSVRELSTFQFAALNSGIFGGPIEAKIEGAHPQSHSLRVVTVDDLRLKAVISTLPKIFSERHLGFPGGSQFSLQEGVLTSSRPCEITLDGEIKTQTPAHIRIHPKALRVVAGSNPES